MTHPEPITSDPTPSCFRSMSRGERVREIVAEAFATLESWGELGNLSSSDSDEYLFLTRQSRSEAMDLLDEIIREERRR
jgi:hypothetical protein